MPEHYRNECIHGVVLGQCRCPNTAKAVHTVPCPDTPGHNEKAAQIEMDAVAEKMKQCYSYFNFNDEDAVL